MQTRTSLARRFFAAAGLACAVLGSGTLGVPTAGANPTTIAPPATITAAPVGATLGPSLGGITVTPAGTGATIEFTSSEPVAARIEVKTAAALPVTALPVTAVPVQTAAPITGPGLAGVGAGFAPPSVAGVAIDPGPPVYEASHRIQLTNLKPGTAYDATVSGDTRGGSHLFSNVHFDTLKQRVRVSVDTIDIQHGGALFGDNTVTWDLGVDWGPGYGYQSINIAGSAETCFPSTDSGDPTGRLVGVCQAGSYGDGTFSPLNNRGKPLTWIFAQENFVTMPTMFTVNGSADESDLFAPGISNPQYPRGCSPTNSTTIPQGAAAGTTTLVVCGDDLNTTFQSLVTFRIEVFYDNTTYAFPKRNGPTNPWA